jgi:hypothetical protein
VPASEPFLVERADRDGGDGDAADAARGLPSTLGQARRAHAASARFGRAAQMRAPRKIDEPGRCCALAAAARRWRAPARSARGSASWKAAARRTFR